ncbi:hypothetical protein DMB42_33490 [Nonomuraea sp. WAC 01424]|nr:hypothetical protein DMB42_33490 [Nonomuraea sp. WAC 01424]
MPELAADTLTGAERAAALHHLAACARCRHDLADMAGLVDSIIALAPPENPPPAFESRVLAGMTGNCCLAAAFHDGRRRVGTAFAYQGSPSWLFLVVQSASGSGAYRATLVRTDGLRVPLGEVPVSGGRGSWGTTIDTPVAQVGRIVLARPGAGDLVAAFWP